MSAIEQNISPFTTLLIDRTIGILMSAPALENISHADDPFVCVLPHVVGSDVMSWVMLSRAEFLQVFAPPSDVAVSARLQ